MNPRLEEIRSELEYVSAELMHIDERAAGANLDDATQATWDEGVAFVAERKAEKEKLEERDLQVEYLRSLHLSRPAAVTPGDRPDPREVPDSVNVNTRSNPYDMTEIRTAEHAGKVRKAAAEYRAQALTAVEQSRPFNGDEGRERATQLIDGPDNVREGISKHILATGTPEYRDAFEDYMRDPEFPSDVMLHARQEQRTAMSEASNGVGGFLLPFVLDPTVILTNSGFVSPIRQIAGSRTTTTNIWHGITSAGVNAEWIGEATEVADASPSFLQPTITCFKADAYVQASMELIADSTISGEIAMLMADAKARLEATAFVVGNGVSQPRGIVTATSGVGNSVAGSSGAANSADLVAADIYAVLNATVARYRNQNTAWGASLAMINKIRQLNSGSAAYQSTFWADFRQGAPADLIGYPLYEISDMDSTIVSGSTDDCLVLGDWSNYLIVDRIGMEIQYNPMVLGSTRRPTGESAWVAFWRTGADCLNSGAFKTLRL